MNINKWENEFDRLFNSLGYDHIETCTCGPLEECKCKSGRERLKDFVASLLSKATKEAVRVREMLEEWSVEARQDMEVASKKRDHNYFYNMGLAEGYADATSLLDEVLHPHSKDEITNKDN